MWRKNRQSPPATVKKKIFYGRDINRNWENNWDASPCGTLNDAPESAAMDDSVRNIQSGHQTLTGQHCFGEVICLSATTGYSMLLSLAIGHLERHR